MNILVTGAKGMVGTALVNNLKNIRDNKNRTRPNISIEDIYEYDLDSTPEELDRYCQKADFIFNLAGVNRPENPEDFMKGNFGFASDLLNTLKNIIIKQQLCFLHQYRLHLQDVLEIQNMGVQKRQARNCFLIMQMKQELRLLYTVFLI